MKAIIKIDLDERARETPATLAKHMTDVMRRAAADIDAGVITCEAGFYFPLRNSMDERVGWLSFAEAKND